ncbi:MAG: hypothetical protein JWM97_552 [Phycisphaerales bacterium]|nr:hypothetical protein [Phycisphaerales bacterium]MDB5303003.1 hypothetical protein [Phycisphaerales bacterium]
MLRVTSRVLAGVVLAAMPAAAVAGPSFQFQATLTPLNNSGVTGTAQFSLNGDQLTYAVQAQGLTPNVFHQEHVHGFLNPVMPSVIPTGSNADVNGDGMIVDIEADRITGGELVFLTAHPTGTSFGNTFSDFPVADAAGNINFTQTYTLEVPQLVAPLNIRAVELHGMFVGGTYEPTLPVATGLITPIGGTGATGVAVPLPAAAPAGLMLGGLLAAAALLRRRRSLV